MAKVDDAHVETVVSYVRNLEHLLEAFAESEVLQMVQEARKLLNYRTLKGAGRECKIFGAFAFGRNVYLPSHQDEGCGIFWLSKTWSCCAFAPWRCAYHKST